jgi:hypothetical protein
MSIEEPVGLADRSCVAAADLIRRLDDVGVQVGICPNRRAAGICAMVRPPERLPGLTGLLRNGDGQRVAVAPAPGATSGFPQR